MNTTTTKLSPAERLAKELGEGMVDSILKTIKETRIIAWVLVICVMVASFQHQRHHLAAREADTIGSVLLPIIYDLAIVFCVRVIGTMGIIWAPKIMAMVAMTLPIYASAKINFEGSPNSEIGWAYVGAVAMIAVVETIKAFIKEDPKAMRKAETSLAIVPADEPAVDEAEIARRKAIADKGNATKAERRAEREAAEAEALRVAELKKEQRRQRDAERRAAKKLEELAPTSPGHPAVMLSPDDQKVLAEMAFPTR